MATDTQTQKSGTDLRSLLRDGPRPGRVAEQDAGALMMLAPEQLVPSPLQPAGRHANLDLVRPIAESIRKNGLQQQPGARPLRIKDDNGLDLYEVRWGHVRIAAVRLLRDGAESEEEKARWAKVPVWVKDVSDQDAAVNFVAENLQRSDLTPLEEGDIYSRFMESHGLTIRQLAERVGQDERRVRRLLQLAGAPEFIRRSVAEGVWVEVLDDRGAPVLTEKGRERKERSTLDLIGALEFERLYRHWKKTPESMPKRQMPVLAEDATEEEKAEQQALRRKKLTAEEATSQEIRRALLERWSVRDIREYAQSIISPERTSANTPEVTPTLAGGDVCEAGMGSPLPLFRSDESELRVFRSRLAGAPVEAKRTLAELLKALLLAIE